MDGIDETNEPEIIRLLLERVKSGEVSIEEASQYFWIKPFHMMKEAELQHELEKHQVNKNKRGRPKSKSVNQRRYFIFWAWLTIVEFWDPSPKERAAWVELFAARHNLDDTEIRKNAVTPAIKHVKFMKKTLGSEYPVYVRKIISFWQESMEGYFE